MPRPRRLAALAALVLASAPLALVRPAGAQGAPPPAAPAPSNPAPPTAGAPGGPAPRPARPVASLADRLPAGTDSVPLTLREAVTRALRVGDETRLAEAQLDATDAQVTVARATALPQLRLQGGYTQVLANARASIVGALFGQNYNYNGNANFSVPLFQGGRAVAGIQGARAARAAGTSNVAETRALVTVDVQRAYLGALAADRLVEIQRQNVALADARLAQIEQLERGGRAARYDVLRARVERTNLEPLLIQARNDREVAYLELKRLVNVPLDRPVALATTVRTDSVAVRALLDAALEAGSDDPSGASAGARGGRATTAGGPASAIARAEGDRALLRVASATVEARRAAVRVARADLLPTVSVFFQTGVLALPSSPRFPSAWGQTSNALCPPGSPTTRICQNNGFFPDRSAGLQFSWPLFDGLRAKGNIDLASAQASVAELQLAQVREQVALEVERARAGVERARALWEAQRFNEREAEEAFSLATLRFQRGLGTQLEVSDAQLALLTARTNALRATLDVYLAAAEQARALGRPIPMPE